MQILEIVNLIFVRIPIFVNLPSNNCIRPSRRDPDRLLVAKQRLGHCSLQRYAPRGYPTRSAEAQQAGDIAPRTDQGHRRR